MDQAIVTGFIESVPRAFREGDANVDVKQIEAENVRCVQEQYRAVGRGDFAAYMDCLADDFVLEIVGPSTVPFLGRWQGRQQAGEAVRNNFAQLEDQQPELQSVVAQGDTVVVIARERGRYRSTHQPYNVYFVQVFTFRDGKAIRLLEIVSDRDVAEAA